MRVAIGGHAYRSTIARMGGQHLIALNAENRRRAGAEPGDAVEVELELDTAPREVTVPPDLAAALEGERAAREFFDGLSYSKRSACVTWIESAKRAQTREARIARAVELLGRGTAPRG